MCPTWEQGMISMDPPHIHARRDSSGTTNKHVKDTRGMYCMHPVTVLGPVQEMFYPARNLYEVSMATSGYGDQVTGEEPGYREGPREPYFIRSKSNGRWE